LEYEKIIKTAAGVDGRYRIEDADDDTGLVAIDT
jgi:hypothetical protein